MTAHERAARYFGTTDLDRPDVRELAETIRAAEVAAYERVAKAIERLAGDFAAEGYAEGAEWIRRGASLLRALKEEAERCAT